MIGVYDQAAGAIISAKVPTITAAVPTVNLSATAKWETNTYDTSIVGVTANYSEVRNVKVASGRCFTDEETESRAKVALVGNTVIEELFKNTDPLGQKIMIKGNIFTVIGILEKKGSTMGSSSDDSIVIPVTVAQRLSGSQDVGSIYLQAKNSDVAKLAVAHITSIFYAKYKREDTVRVTSQDELLDTISSTTLTITLMLAAIAGISLLVGGIGIMNIMLVTVTERTREIGIRKALGAKRSNIMSQFIAESVFLSVSGGVIGIALGITVSKIVAVFAKWSTVISPMSILISFAFAMAVGIFFGVYPAYKAANLDPIVALRRE
jgi:putative ABC transport system permease protein